MWRCCAIKQKLKSRHVSKSRAQALRMAPSPSAKQTVTLLWKDFMRIFLWRHPAVTFDKSQGNKLPTTCRGCTFLSLLHSNQNPLKNNLYPAQPKTQMVGCCRPKLEHPDAFPMSMTMTPPGFVAAGRGSYFYCTLLYAWRELCLEILHSRTQLIAIIIQLCT